MFQCHTPKYCTCDGLGDFDQTQVRMLVTLCYDSVRNLLRNQMTDELHSAFSNAFSNVEDEAYGVENFPHENRFGIVFYHRFSIIIEWPNRPMFDTERAFEVAVHIKDVHFRFGFSPNDLVKNGLLKWMTYEEYMPAFD